MMRPDIFPILAFKDNYIWTWVDKASKKAWVVDPGDAAPVLEMLVQNGWSLGGILLTHHHYDHSGGIQELITHSGKVPVYGSHRSSISAITHPIQEGDEIECSPFQLKILEIPGHTLDHVAYFNDELLFSGDTLFSAGCGKVFEGTYEQMYHSLTKLKLLPDDIYVYCGHEYTEANLHFAEQVEPENQVIKDKLHEVKLLRQAKNPTLPSILRDEKRINPFLRCQEPKIVQMAELKANKHLSNSIEVFKTLREWKNNL